MRKTVTLLLPFLLPVFIFSCQKEIDPSIILNRGGTGVPSPADNYQPLAPGSWWKYKDSASGTITILTATQFVKKISNITYTAVTSNQTSDTAYQAAPQPNYFFYQKGFTPNTGAPYELLIHYLNDTASTGFNWQYPAGQGNGFEAQITTTIKERNISVTVAGRTYDNVIHTKLELKFDVPGSITYFSYYDYFIAKGVGVIRVRSVLPGMDPACTDLVDFQVK